PHAARRLRSGPRLLLTDGAGATIPIETLSGSQSFARRLGASRVTLDYPSTDSVYIRPAEAEAATVSLCPIEDWLFWPLLGGLRSLHPTEASRSNDLA